MKMKTLTKLAIFMATMVCASATHLRATEVDGLHESSPSLTKVLRPLDLPPLPVLPAVDPTTHLEPPLPVLPAVDPTTHLEPPLPVLPAVEFSGTSLKTPELSSTESSQLKSMTVKYNCVSNSMNEIANVFAKNKDAVATLAAQCALDGPRHTALLATKTANLAAVTLKEEKRIAGNLPVVPGCTLADACATPNSIRAQDLMASENTHDRLNGESEGRIADSAGLVTQGTKKFAVAKELEDAEKLAVARAIAQANSNVDEDIKQLGAKLTEKVDFLNQMAADERNTASNRHDDDLKLCDQTYGSRQALIENDKNTLKEIKAHMATLLSCPKVDPAPSMLLETSAASRSFRAHCKLSRQMLQKAMPTGNVADWVKRVDQEALDASTQHKECGAAAETTKSVTIYGPADAPNTAGIDFTLAQAINSATLIEKNAVAQKRSDLVNDIAIQNQKLVFFRSNCKEAQAALDEIKAGYGVVAAAEAAVATSVTNDKEKADEVANTLFKETVSAQKVNLDALKNAIEKAFDDESLIVTAACSAESDELAEETRVIGEIKAKIDTLKIVGDGKANVDGDANKDGGAEAPIAPDAPRCNECDVCDGCVYDPLPNGDGSCPKPNHMNYMAMELPPQHLAWLLSLSDSELLAQPRGARGYLSVDEIRAMRPQQRSGLGNLIDEYFASDEKKELVVAKYGTIENWNTKFVTNLKCAFSGMSSFNADISLWDVSSVTTLHSTFKDAAAFNADLSNWVVTSVTSLADTFQRAYKFNANISQWVVSSVTDLRKTFSGANNFNADISKWVVSNVTNMYGTFSRASSFNADISKWEVSSVTTFEDTFNGASLFNADISKWMVSSVTSMANTFNRASSFNADISNWVVSSVITLQYTFQRAYKFNANISQWVVSSVTSMTCTFYGASSFNQDIGSWDVSSVANLVNTFGYAKAFNADISQWDVSNVTLMAYTFNEASSFNADLSKWVVLRVTSMHSTFKRAEAFNADISQWDVSSVTDMQQTFERAKAFNADISKWDVSSAISTQAISTPFSKTFDHADSFNFKDISKWGLNGILCFKTLNPWPGIKYFYGASGRCPRKSD